MAANIPSSGWQLQRIIENAPRSAILVSIPKDKIDELKGAPTVQLITGKTSALRYGRQSIDLNIKPEGFVNELYHRTNDKLTFYANATYQANIAQVDDALLALKQSLSQYDDQKKATQTQVSTAVLPEPKNRREAEKESKKGGILGITRQRGSRHVSPVAAPTSAYHDPASTKTKAIRRAVIHLLAIRELSTEDVAAKVRLPVQELKTVLQTLAQAIDGKWKLSDKAYKELNVWRFNYPEDSRQAAIDKAIRAYDRLRLSKDDKLWQLLLPKAERDKGKVLSRLHLGGNVSSRVASPLDIYASSAVNSPRGQATPKHSTLFAKDPQKARALQEAKKRKEKTTDNEAERPSKRPQASPKVKSGESEDSQKGRALQKRKERPADKEEEHPSKRRQPSPKSTFGASEDSQKGRLLQERKERLQTEKKSGESEDSQKGRALQKRKERPTDNEEERPPKRRQPSPKGRSGEPEDSQKARPLQKRKERPTDNDEERPSKRQQSSSKVKSAEFVHSSDDEDSKPIHKAKSHVDTSKVNSKTNTKSSTQLKQIPKPTSEAKPQTHIPPPKALRPTAPSPLGAARPRLASDGSDRSGISQRTQKGLDAMSTPRKHTVTSTETRSPVLTAAKSATESQTLNSSTNGHQKALSITSSTNTQSSNALASQDRFDGASSDSSTSIVDTITFAQGVTLAAEFQDTYYPRYAKMYDSLAERQHRGEAVGSEEMKKLWEMHNRLEQMKGEIYAAAARKQAGNES